MNCSSLLWEHEAGPAALGLFNVGVHSAEGSRGPRTTHCAVYGANKSITPLAVPRGITSDVIFARPFLLRDSIAVLSVWPECVVMGRCGDNYAVSVGAH